jgi:uncharacterized RDD family membrane protein YckC
MSEPARRLQPIDTTAEIETPEHVRFHYPVAGPARRVVAWVLDYLIRGAILLVFAIIALMGGLAVGDAIADLSKGVLLVIHFLLEWFYYTLWEIAWNGRTPGKRALDLRVVTVDGHPLRIGDSFLRNLLRVADFLPFGYAAGLIAMARDGRFRRLGDMVAGTMVIVEERRAVASTLRIDPPPTPKELASLPQRLPLSGDELEAIELFLRRKDRLGPAREEELASIVAPLFASRMGLRNKDSARLLALLHARASERRRPA